VSIETLATSARSRRTTVTAALVAALALAVAAAGCGNDASDDPPARVLGVTVTTSTTAPEVASPPSTSPPAPAVGPAPTTTAPASAVTTTTIPPAPGAGTVDVTYQAIRQNPTITVDLETEAGAVAATRDASATGRAAFEGVAPGRYRVAVSEVGSPEQSGDTETSSAVTTRTELFDVVPGGSVSVSCVGNGDCTVVA